MSYKSSRPTSIPINALAKRFTWLVTLSLLGAMGPHASPSAAMASPQTNNQTETTGALTGTITPQVSSGFHVRLLDPATNKAIAKKEVGASAKGKFVLDHIPPGTYQLSITVRDEFSSCPYLPWSKKITIEAGQTLSVSAKIRIHQIATCE